MRERGKTRLRGGISSEQHVYMVGHHAVRLDLEGRIGGTSHEFFRCQQRPAMLLEKRAPIVRSRRPRDIDGRHDTESR